MTYRNARRIAGAVFVAAGLGAAMQVAAADKPREASFGKAKPGGLLLTPAQLRACLDQQEQLHTRTAETVKDHAAFSADKVEIERLTAALKEQAVTLDRTSADAVAAYNAQVETRDKLLDKYQGGVPAFNEKAEALKAEQAAFAKACENRRYEENDEIAIRKGKR
ncbi:MAG: hypothetical protein ABI809_12955 [Caldimonas sp.]